LHFGIRVKIPSTHPGLHIDEGWHLDNLLEISGSEDSDSLSWLLSMLDPLYIKDSFDIIIDKLAFLLLFVPDFKYVECFEINLSDLFCLSSMYYQLKMIL